MPDQLDAARFERRRDEQGLTLGKPFHHVVETGSTNDDALAAARSGAPHGATFVADAQSAGRGRRGRHWFAAPGESLLCSLLLREQLGLERAALLALVAGLAVRSAIANACSSADQAARVRVKWPNDVFIDERKVAGVLCESHVQGPALVATVVGFGVNVSGRAFPDELHATATSLALASVHTTREDLLLDVLRGLERRVATLVNEGVVALVTELAQNDALFGRRVRIDGVEGVAAGFDHTGRLLLRSSQDEMLPFSAGSVEVVR
jgi:BirA family biotin operon repressor/biotin-[acetyl-CoA-carboxylase] ligase